MNSTPACTIRMRSRFDDCFVSKTETSRPKSGSGRNDSTRSATPGAKINHLGRLSASSITTAAPHPIQTLRVNVNRSEKHVMAVTPARKGLLTYCSQRTKETREITIRRDEKVIA